MPWKDNPIVPMDDLGNMYRIVPRYQTTRPVNMVAVEPMTRALKFVRFSMLTSSVTVVMEDANGRTYPMSITHFEKLIQDYPLDRGATPVLTWGYQKQGSGYSILVEEGN